MKDKWIYKLPDHIDSANSEEFEKDLFNKIADNTKADIELDAAELQYISSAGLRVLLKLAKLCPKKIRILQLKDSVMDIFTTTGFDSIFLIDHMRGKIDGTDCLYQDAFMSIYPTGEETVLLVNHKYASIEDAERALVNAREMQKNKVPAVISYKILSHDNAYGVETERFEYAAGKVREGELQNLAEELRTLHEKQPENLPASCISIKAEWLRKLESRRNMISDTEYEDLRKMIESIPMRKNFIHGLANEKNIVQTKEGYLFINLQRGGCGHPIFDLIQCTELPDFKDFLSRYFKNTEEAFLEKRSWVIKQYKTLEAWLFAEDEDLEQRLACVREMVFSEYEKTIAYLDW